MSIPQKLFVAVIAIVLLCSVLALIAWGDWATDTPEVLAARAQRARAYAGRTIETGAELYSRDCAPCHGARGEGVAAVAPAIRRKDLFDGQRAREVRWNGSIETFLQITLRAGRPIPSRPDLYSARMPAWDSELGGMLSAGAIDALVAFLLNWGADAPVVNAWNIVPVPTRTPTPATPAPGLALARVCVGLSAPYAGKQSPYRLDDKTILAQGKQIYDDKCAACHGASGKGDGPAAAVLNPRPANLTDKNFMQTLPVDCHFFVIAEGVRGTAMPPWKSLGEETIWKVLVYTRSLSGVP
jgi:mono/diheme cytochrome c family protein